MGDEFDKINYVLMITILPWEQCDCDCSSHYCDVTWTWWYRRSRATRMDDQQVVKTHKKVNIKAPHYLPCVVEIRWSSVDPTYKGPVILGLKLNLISERDTGMSSIQNAYLRCICDKRMHFALLGFWIKLYNVTEKYTSNCEMDKKQI